MHISTRTRLIFGGALLCLCLLGQRALALSLGEPRVVAQTPSHWVVEVPLADLGSISPDQIQVRLAAPAFWQAAGLKLLDAQTVRVLPSPQEGMVRLELTSPPGFVDVLIQLQWPNGSLQRTLGLLLGASNSVLMPQPDALEPIRVQPGDTASQLVAPYLSDSDTMAQGLQALLQANPDAFVAGNVNRLRAGAVLKPPSPEAIQAIDPAKASEALAQQIEAFALYRQQGLASTEARPDDSAQVATGKVQPTHRDQPASAADRLTLSVPDADAQSDRIAQQKQAQQTADRAAEIHRNIQDLNRLAQSDGAGLPTPAPIPEQASSAWIGRLVDHPWTPWAALGLLMSLTAAVIWRALRGSGGTEVEPQTEEGLAPLRVDFDLNLPPADALPSLSPDLAKPPTPVERSVAPLASAGAAPGTDPMAGLSLDLPDLGASSHAFTDLPAPATDPWSLRLHLAKALHARGLTHTALVLAREVAAQAPEPTAQDARVWLDERV